MHNTDRPPAQLPFPTVSAPLLNRRTLCAKLRGGMEDGLGFITMYPPESKQEKVCQKLSFPIKKAIKNLLCQRLHQESFENSYF